MAKTRRFRALLPARPVSLSVKLCVLGVRWPTEARRNAATIVWAPAKRDPGAGAALVSPRGAQSRDAIQRRNGHSGRIRRNRPIYRASATSGIRAAYQHLAPASGDRHVRGGVLRLHRRERPALRAQAAARARWRSGG